MRARLRIRRVGGWYHWPRDAETGRSRRDPRRRPGGLGGGCLGPDGDDRPRHERRTDVRDGLRQRQPERDGHDVVRRVRDDDGLRLEDVVRERRLRLEQRRGRPRTVESQAGHHVPLPRRRDVERRDRPRRRRPADDAGSAGGITGSAATLHGTVDPNTRATSWYFEVGTSTSYGTKTAAKDAGSGTAALDVAAQVSGLQTGRTYHYRLVATSDAGTSRGADKTFLTAAAPTVAMKAASSIRDTSVTLNGSVNPNGQETSAYFEYGTTTGYGSRSASKNVGAGTGSTNVSISVTGLAPGRTYHIRLVASNASGKTTGVDATVATTGPPVVRTGSATGIGYSNATLTGSVLPSGHSTTWYFQYGTTTGYGGKTATQRAGLGLATRSVSAGLSNLAAATTYHYRLVATSGAGTVVGADTTFATATPASTIA